MFDTRQLIWLSIATIVPIVIILLRKDSWLVFWICLILTVNVFDTNLNVNISASRICGFLLLPNLIKSIPKLLNHFPGRLLLWITFYSICLAVILGYIFPWGEGGYTRTVNQSSNGRALLSIVRIILDMSVTMFIAKWTRNNFRFDIIKFLLISTSISAIGVFLQSFTQIDIYNELTGLGINLASIDRARGFNFEPRGAGLVLAQGIALIMSAYFQFGNKSLFLLLLLHVTAFIIAASASATAVLFVCVGLLFILNMRDKKVKRLSLLIITALIFSLLFMLFAANSSFILNFNSKIIESNNSDLVATNWIESIAYQMDIFDSASFLFLVNNPIYILTGTGPGLISLPASEYIPKSANAQWAIQDGINSLPSMGWLLEISNAGLINSFIWIILMLNILRNFKLLIKSNYKERSNIQLGENTFLVGTITYLIQASATSSMISLFLGIGMGVSDLQINKSSCDHEQ